MKTSINLTIDHRPVRVPVGTTIMAAAEKIGIRVLTELQPVQGAL